MDHIQSSLNIAFAQVSLAGTKRENQDTIGARIPDSDSNILANKGIAIAIADGVSTSQSAKQASQLAITGFLSDYYATPDTWRTGESATQVIQSLNRYLWSLGLNSPRQEGMLTTFSSLILKGDTGFSFHVGDSRIYRLRNGYLEQLTRDHAQRIDRKTTYLSRALGADSALEIDMQSFEIEVGDYYLLTTDGIHDILPKEQLTALINANTSNLEEACQSVTQQALESGSEDNLSIQLCRIESKGAGSQSDTVNVLSKLPFPPILNVGNVIDGLTIKKILQESERSQVYLVTDAGDREIIMKTPSINYNDDLAYIERFVMENWIGRRIQNSRIVNVIEPPQERSFLYYLTEYLEGQSLTQLIKERAPINITDATEITEEIIKGIRAFHRKDTLHQDIKPDNIIVTSKGPVIIDFGSCWVAGISEMSSTVERDTILGTLDYSAPEYRFGGRTSSRSDLFSAAVILYEMLTQKHPYGTGYQKAMHLKAFQKLNYRPATAFNPLVPFWLDKALEKALHIQPEQRYSSLSEFLQDIKRPNPYWQPPETQPLLQRNPLRFWQVLAALGWFCSLMLIIQIFT